MPTGSWRRSAGVLPFGAFASLGADYPMPSEVLISTVSAHNSVGDHAIGLDASAFTSASYPAANRAIAVPLVLAHPFLVQKVFWVNGTTATTDSADVGVYTEAGGLLVSGGGTAISGASSMQEADVTDTLLRPGRYWIAYAQNGTTATPFAQSYTAAGVLRCTGAAQMDTAYVLPSTFTPAAVTGTVLPLFGIAARTLAA